MTQEPIDENEVFNKARRLAVLEERVAYLQQVCGHEPRALHRIVELLNVHFQESSFLESPAVAPCTTLEALRPQSPGAHLSLGAALMDNGQLEEAIDAFRKAVQLNPDYAEAYANLGLVLTNLGRLLVRRQMSHWLQDADFHGVRGTEALSKLPEAERQSWQQLWREVAETLAASQRKANPKRKPDTK